MSFVDALSKLFTRKKPCVTCGEISRDVLVSDGDNWSYYCRFHLIDSFTRLFQEAEFKMVIFEFDVQASKYTGEIYGYYPYSKLSQFRWTEDEQQVVQILLDKIDTQALCQQCKATNCQIVYLSKEAAPWERSTHILEEYKDKGELLCSSCALDRLLPILRNNSKHFAEGLYLPYQEAGMYITTEL